MPTLTVFNKHKQYQYDGTAVVDWDNDTINVAIFTSDYTPDIDIDAYFDDISGELTAGNGYTAGGETLEDIDITLDTTNDRVDIDASDVTWTFAAYKNFKYAVIYKSTGNPATSPLIGYVDFGEQSILGKFRIQWYEDGIVRIA